MSKKPVKQPQPSLHDVFQTIKSVDLRLSEHIEDSKQVHEEVLAAVNTFATHVDSQFAQVKEEINHIKNVMVTKEYLDDKLFQYQRKDVRSLVA